MKYAKDTEVSVEKSRLEIETTLTRYGATAFAYATQPERAMIIFEACGRRIRFDVPLPRRDAREFKFVKHRGRHFETERTPEQAYKAWEQACRQRWRALALVIKAKLEAVECGITTFEEEFLAHIVLPNGQNVGSWMLPQVKRAYDSGTMPPLLTGPAQRAPSEG